MYGAVLFDREKGRHCRANVFPRGLLNSENETKHSNRKQRTFWNIPYSFGYLWSDYRLRMTSQFCDADFVNIFISEIRALSLFEPAYVFGTCG
ncbi:hypothetical protein CEXT_545481 [Caerostris extrusa]|uniref:Uncharacterized protein n=1 Tax=Caerostris extrusa TaxID=172846 RepID=A0AAV4NDV8_CAEEX|nr:hypothetical protein CEXT_545481 [Caerostris extrusa]